MVTPRSLYESPNALAPHYSRSHVDCRLLLSGHSHQAWPDRSFEGQVRAWQDAAEHLDMKWEQAQVKAHAVRAGFSGLIEDTSGYMALAPNTHDLVIRFLSALPLRRRPRLVTTDGEFHTIRRQLERIAEEGIEIVRVPSAPAALVAERLMDALDERTSAVMVSSVFFRSGHIVPGLGSLMEACRRVGSELLIDAYHSLNVAPFSIERERLQGAFVVGGGYKYCQLGEGNCFLRFPKECEMRPVITGWFSEFETLSSGRKANEVIYGQGPLRFAGSTYDPTSHYRAAEVFSFFSEMGLSPQLLREVSQHQVGLLARLFDEMDANPKLVTRDRSLPLEAIGGFLVLLSPQAEKLCRLLAERGVSTDFRGDALRLGPAPYLSDRQLTEAMDILRSVVQII